MRKRVLAAVLTLAMMFSLSVSASAANTTVRTEDVKISVDGKTVDVPKGSIWISEDGYTMVGARALAEGRRCGDQVGFRYPHRCYQRYDQAGRYVLPRGRL